MACEGGGDFVGSAGDWKLAKTLNGENASARQSGKPGNASEKREQRDVAKRDAVAGSGQRFERERGAVEREDFADVGGKLGLRIARDFHSGELPHAREEDVVVGAGIADKNRATARIAEDGRGNAHFHGGRLATRGGNFFCEVASASTAAARDRTVSAARRLRGADRLAQFHEGLIPVAGRFRREEALSHCPKALPAARRAKIAANGGDAGEDAGDVAVEDRERNIVSDAEDGRRGVAANPGKRERGFQSAWEFAMMASNDFFRRGVEITRATVVTEAGPEAQDFLLRGGGEHVDGGKFFEEAVVIGEDGGNARLLQHDLGDPDAVGVAADAPGEVAAMSAEPGQEFGAKGVERARS